jgi:hypothetical protein
LKIRCPRACSPSRSLLEVRFLWVLMSLDFWFLIRLHRARLFNEAKQPTYDTDADTGRSCLLNSLESPLVMASLPGAWIIVYGAYVVFILCFKPFFKLALWI